MSSDEHTDTMGLARGLIGKRRGQWAQFFGRRLFIVALSALALLSGGLALVLMYTVDRQIAAVLALHEVSSVASDLTIAVADAQSGQRAYVLTGDAVHLQALGRAEREIRSRVLALNQLTGEDPARSTRLRVITDRLEAYQATLTRTMALESARGDDPAGLDGPGLDIDAMTGLRVALRSFIDEERRSLDERNQAIDQSRRWLAGAIIVALSAVVLLAYLALVGMPRQRSGLGRQEGAAVAESGGPEGPEHRTDALEEARQHAERERRRAEALLQDANHRIGNSLSTVSSLLALQLLRSQSDEVRRALEAARSRVHSIASAHRRLRLGDDFETASTDDFLDAVLEDLAMASSDAKNVQLIGHFDPIIVPARDATTLGILVGELVTNAVKHGFPDGRQGVVTVTLKRDPAGVPKLCVVDDGVGFGGGQPGEGGLGSMIVRQLATQFGGAPHYENRAGGGLIVTVSLPGIEVAASANRH